MAIKISAPGVVHIWDQYYSLWIRTGSYINGLFVPNEEQTLIRGFKASIQPAQSRDLNLFPEGTQLTDANFAFSTTPIPIDDYQDNPGNYDVRIIYNDENGYVNAYRILSTNPWNSYYYRYFIVQTRFLDEIPELIMQKIKGIS